MNVIVNAYRTLRKTHEILNIFGSILRFLDRF
jgi:hypothetical protein